MTIHDPMALATDYLLGAGAVFFAVKLWRVHRMWALAFVFTACASFFGGTFHGIAETRELWKATVLSVGAASFFLLAGYSRVFGVLATIKLVVYSTWMITHDDFVWVIADYGLTLLLIGLAAALRRTSATPWLLGSIAVSVAGAIVQQARVTLHPQFSHNDLYHVIQLVALWLLYRAGHELGERAPATRSATVRSTTQPT